MSPVNSCCLAAEPGLSQARCCSGPGGPGQAGGAGDQRLGMHPTLPHPPTQGLGPLCTLGSPSLLQGRFCIPCSLTDAEGTERDLARGSLGAAQTPQPGADEDNQGVDGDSEVNGDSLEVWLGVRGAGRGPGGGRGAMLTAGTGAAGPDTPRCRLICPRQKGGRARGSRGECK